MSVLKAILLTVAVICVPLTSFFLVRLALKLSRAVDQINRSLDDARPHMNQILVNVNRTLEEINEGLGGVVAATSEVQHMISEVDAGLQALENALRSPWARWVGTLAGLATARSLVSRVFRPGQA